MTQGAHFTASATPADITAGLAAGCYIAQPRGVAGTPGVIYATAPAAPADTDDYYQCGIEEAFRFTAGSDEPPVWVATDPILRQTVGDAVGVPVAFARADE